jgi:large subunit ribosomal protein L13
MDMNKIFYLRKEDRAPQWLVVDAQGLVLGRLATKIADVLRGKHKACYAPHTDCGDYVIVINAEKVDLTGDKWTDKEYTRYTGWIGGFKVRTAQEVRAKQPEFLIEHAVQGMLPKNRLSRQLIKKLKVYAGNQHPHKAHAPKTLAL